jgi:molybdate transport system ATP-binding protein
MLLVDVKKKLGSSFQLNVQFETGDGILALLGASGCGKSMTLKCIAGIEKPDEGHIELNGRVLYSSKKRIDLPPQQRRVGYLFQSCALFPHMTVWQNIGAGVRATGRAERERIIQEKIQSFYLVGMEQKYPSQLSGGQQQRAALARMMASEPEAILLDEPFSALDSYLKWQLEQELFVALEPFGGSAVFVSHNRDEVYRLCDRVCLIDSGRSEGVSDLRTLMEQPGTLSAALLAGCKNFSRANRLRDGLVFAQDWGAELDCERDISAEIGYIGVHAHRVTVCAEGEPNAYAAARCA